MSNQWPTQRECDSFYGNPRGPGGAVFNKTWYAANITTIVPPFKMAMGNIKITKIPFHKKAAPALARALDRIWEASGRNQAVIDKWGASVFSGTFNYRPMRGLSSLSMHAYGIAIDLDAPRNSLGDQTPNFANAPEVLKAFKAEGAIWGGDWNGNGSSLDERRADGMHFQWARLG